MAKSAVQNFTPPSLPIESQVESVAPPEESQKTEDPNDGLASALQLVVIIAVSIVAISIVYLLFKPAPTTNGEVLTLDDYDE